jgi:pimeloyl-ACP methyl ester carboxylesterase
MPFREQHYTCINSHGHHKIVFNDWGPDDGMPVICVHGLTGNGHDFDFIAPELVKDGYRVIAVDLPGRGRSDFLDDPLDYNYNQYCNDLIALLQELGLNKPGAVDWLGVSLGGVLGIRLAGIENSPIRRLILNDVGPVVPQNALDFIHMVISQTYTFDTLHDLELRMRATRGLTWGQVTDEQWNHMARHNARALDNGLITYGYDPGIADIFKTEPTGDQDLWSHWEAINCPVLILHGKKSVVLTPEIIADMKDTAFSSTDITVKTFSDCGHVPSLMAPEQIKVIRQWMRTT